MMNEEIYEMVKPMSNKKGKAKKMVKRPEFKMRAVGAKIGKGSYRRKNKFKTNYSDYV